MINDGDLLEYRLARLVFHMKYAPRRRVLLQIDEKDFTDIDIYAIKFDNDFKKIVTLVDCKSGSTKRGDSTPSNRILWLNGLKTFLHAEKGYVVLKSIPGSFKEFSLSNGIIPLDFKRIEEIEKQLSIEGDWRGSYSKDLHDVIIGYQKECKSQRGDFYDLFSVITKNYWTSSNSIQIKQIMNRINLIVKKGDIKADFQVWIFVECSILFSISIIEFCHSLFSIREIDRADFIRIKMIEGIGNIEQQQKLLFLSRMYAESIIEKHLGKQIKIQERDYLIPPPKYTDHLVELLSRTMSKPDIAIHIPRFIDFFMYEYIISNKDVNKEELKILFPVDLDLLAKLSKNIINFMYPQEISEKIFSKLLKL